MDENPRAALKSRLTAEIAALAPIPFRACRRTEQEQASTRTPFATRALASYVDDLYSGIERICERVAVTLDGGLPTGRTVASDPPLSNGSTAELTAHPCFRRTYYPTQMNTAAFVTGFATFTGTNWNQSG